MPITKPRKLQYFGSPAEVWEVRAHGAASIRTRYLRWTTDGVHYTWREPVTLDDGTKYIAMDTHHHRAGDVYATTVTGLGGTHVTLIPEWKVPPGAPTDQLVTERADPQGA